MLMISRRRALWIGAAFLLCLAVLADCSFWLLSHRSSRVNEAAFAKIHDGMTEEEVNELLGAGNQREEELVELLEAGNLRSVGYQRDMTVEGRWVILSRTIFYSEDDESWLIPGDVIVVKYSGGHLTKRYCTPTHEQIGERMEKRLKKLIKSVRKA